MRVLNANDVTPFDIVILSMHNSKGAAISTARRNKAEMIIEESGGYFFGSKYFTAISR